MFVLAFLVILDQVVNLSIVLFKIIVIEKESVMLPTLASVYKDTEEVIAVRMIVLVTTTAPTMEIVLVKKKHFFINTFNSQGSVQVSRRYVRSRPRE